MADTLEHGYIKLTTQGDTWEGELEPVGYRWYGSTGGDSCVLQDGYGRECFSSVSPSDNYIDVKSHPQPKQGADIVHDLKLLTMGSGILEVHYRWIEARIA